MELDFARSGGFAGPATSIDGKVVIADGIGRVTSSLGYLRDLAPEEVGLLSAASARIPRVPSASPGRLRDAYQYDIRISQNGGPIQSVTVRGDSSPEAADLLAWVRQECDRIWTYRINKQPE